jgi:YebC/PmpR family DNA-binding regulatory protein
MGAQWKAAGRAANANKKGMLVSKLIKEIVVSVKLGGPDPDGNFRLRGALAEARKNSVTRDAIDRAIKRGSGQTDDTVTYETIVYEGFCPHQVPIMVECLTENRNRTAADIRGVFRKGQLGTSGAVAWMFDRKGVVEAHFTDADADIETVAIEAGADEVVKVKPSEGQPTDGVIARFTCAMTELDTVNKFLNENKWNILSSELSYIAKNFVDLSDDQMKEVGEFLEGVDDNDDVHRIYVGLKPQE